MWYPPQNITASELTPSTLTTLQSAVILWSWWIAGIAEVRNVISPGRGRKGIQGAGGPWSIYTYSFFLIGENVSYQEFFQNEKILILAKVIAF